MRKEAKRAAKREARHAKEQAKQERKAAKAARKGGSPTADDIDPGEGVRIVPADPARPSPDAPPGVATPSGDSVPTAAGGRTVTVIAADDLPDPVYLEGDLAASAAGETPARPRVFIDDRDPATGDDGVARGGHDSRPDGAAPARAARRRPPCDQPQAAEVAGRGHDAGRGRRRHARRARLGLVRHPQRRPAGRRVQPRRRPRRHRRRRRRCERAASRHRSDRAATRGDPVGGGRPRHHAVPARAPGSRSASGVRPSPIRAPTRRIGCSTTTAGCSTWSSAAARRRTPRSWSPTGRTWLPARRRRPDIAPPRCSCSRCRRRCVRWSASVGVDREGTDLRMELTNGVQVRFGPAQDLVDKIVRLQVAAHQPRPQRGRADPTHRRLERRRHPPVRMRRDAAVTCDNGIRPASRPPGRGHRIQPHRPAATRQPARSRSMIANFHRYELTTGRSR